MLDLPRSVLSAALALAALCAGTAQAHPGHDLFNQSATHALTSPFHLIVLALIGAAFFLAAKLARSPKVQQSMRAGGAALILLSLLVWTLNH